VPETLRRAQVPTDTAGLTLVQIRALLSSSRKNSRFALEQPALDREDPEAGLRPKLDFGVWINSRFVVIIFEPTQAPSQDIPFI
jgi:hypothetical protein